MHTIILAVTFGLICALTAFGQDSANQVQKAAESFVAAYNQKNYQEIENRFNQEMKTAVPSANLTKFLDDLMTNYGKISKLGAPMFSTAQVATFPVEFEQGKMMLLVALDAAGKMGGLSVTAPPPDPTQNSLRNQTKLGLPLRGEWFVVWGGDTVEQNQHQNAPNQRFAFDLLKTDSKGATHSGDGARNEDYYAFGQDILAPADGIVVYAVDGVEDNQPGRMNRMLVPGNMLVIKHRDGEYSLLAHLKVHSLRVKVGDKITKGQVVGLCGNSGNSSEPHLHFQVQNAAFFADEASMKTYFEKLMVKRDGKTEMKTDYSPVKGDSISQN